jgi:hypothetical protein
MEKQAEMLPATTCCVAGLPILSNSLLSGKHDVDAVLREHGFISLATTAVSELATSLEALSIVDEASPGHF